MHNLLRLVGFAVFLPSLALAIVTAANFQVPHKVERFAVSAESPDLKIEERFVPVPPFNRTPDEAAKLGKQWGWVCFNVSLPNQGKPGYEAGGIILYEPSSKEKSAVVMRVVNETDFGFLIWTGMEDMAWNICRIYAEVYLYPTQPYKKFLFENLDNASKYCVFFRGLDDGVEDTIILVSIKELWYEYSPLIPANTTNAAVIGSATIFGLALTILGFKHRKSKKRLSFRKRR